MDDPLAWLLAAEHATAATLPPRRRIEPTRLNHPMAWADGAACTHIDTEDFFRVDGLYSDEVVDACRACPVLAACREWGLRNEDSGYWGGMSERERRRQRRILGITLATPDPDPDPEPETL